MPQSHERAHQDEEFDGFSTVCVVCVVGVGFVEDHGP